MLGEKFGRPYLLSVRARPSTNNPEEFAVTVHYNDSETESSIAVARIDMAHGYTHFDKLYRRDEPKEPVDLSLWEAVERLESNWRTYAESYERLD
ncbi:hypothetical protein BRD04_02760 [Halobacteriales archaeon QS_9_67_17]|nr:MAG: hypothetical protein BRD04_02760 [Halobacteriales archaeon QS_9_67_17]